LFPETFYSNIPSIQCFLLHTSGCSLFFFHQALLLLPSYVVTRWTNIRWMRLLLLPRQWTRGMLFSVALEWCNCMVGCLGPVSIPPS
jgi:hypothetical protein